MTHTVEFAKRTDWTLSSNKLTCDLKRLRAQKVPILDLTESNPTHCEFSYLNNEILMSLQGQANLCYAPDSRGTLQAREAICRYYNERGHTVHADQIFLTASTSEAYTYLFRLLVNPGEQVLFPRPSYPLFSFLGDLNDVRMDTYPLVYESKWSIDCEAMTSSFCNDAKAVVLVNPNNPTGSFVQSDDIETLNRICRDNNVALICDEVFSDYSFDSNKAYSSLVGNTEVLTFVLGGISKALGLPQMKLSWIIVNGPKELAITACARLEVIADTYLSVNTPTQNALSVCMAQSERIQKEIRGRIGNNYDFLKENTKFVNSCELYISEGGWYAVLKIDNTISEEEWVLTLLNKEHVYVHPGYFFDFNSETFFVISLLPPKNIFQEGVRRMLRCINERGSGNKPATSA